MTHNWSRYIMVRRIIKWFLFYVFLALFYCIRWKLLGLTRKSSSICWITGSYFETITRKLWQQHLSIQNWHDLYTSIYLHRFINVYIGTIYDITVPCHGKEFYQYYLVYTYFNKVQRQMFEMSISSNICYDRSSSQWVHFVYMYSHEKKQIRPISSINRWEETYYNLHIQYLAGIYFSLG